jgi:long-chain acyl-CoA synthetase
MNLASLAERNIEERGEYECLVAGDRVWTNRALYDASRRLATALTTLGLSPGDKVVVLLANCPEVLIAYPALWRSGLIIIPVLFVLEAREVRHILENSGARAILTSPELHPKVAAATAGLAPIRVIVTGSAARTPEGCSSFDEILNAAAPQEHMLAREGNDTAVILYTSGTTGQPKGVILTHHNLHANVMNGMRTSPRDMSADVSLLVLPLAHIFGISVLIHGYLRGGKSVMMPWFQAEQALQLIEQYKVTAMAGVPAMFIAMLNHPNAHQYDTSSMQRWLVGAAPMPVEHLRRFEEKFGGIMYVGYGLTETSPGVAGEREGIPRKPGSTGLPVEGVQVKIMCDSGKELPRGEKGEICVKGENVTPGYYKMPEATRAIFRDGWLLTGDIGYLDEDGYLFIVERKKDLIIRGGFNVYPKDVEDIIHSHPAVQECAVVAAPSETMGEEVCAYVVKRPGEPVTEEEIIAHCQASLAKYKTPRFVQFLPALPKTITGKIQKKELRALARSLAS